MREIWCREIGGLLSGLGVEATDAQIAAFVQECDTNRDGTVERMEFVRVLYRRKLAAARRKYSHHAMRVHCLVCDAHAPCGCGCWLSGKCWGEKRVWMMEHPAQVKCATRTISTCIGLVSLFVTIYGFAVFSTAVGSIEGMLETWELVRCRCRNRLPCRRSPCCECVGPHHQRGVGDAAHWLLRWIRRLAGLPYRARCVGVWLSHKPACLFSVCRDKIDWVQVSPTSVTAVPTAPRPPPVASAPCWNCRRGAKPWKAAAAPPPTARAIRSPRVCTTATAPTATASPSAPATRRAHATATPSWATPRRSSRNGAASMYVRCHGSSIGGGSCQALTWLAAQLCFQRGSESVAKREESFVPPNTCTGSNTNSCNAPSDWFSTTSTIGCFPSGDPCPLTQVTKASNSPFDTSEVRTVSTVRGALSMQARGCAWWC